VLVIELELHGHAAATELAGKARLAVQWKPSHHVVDIPRR
jgi:hypothetical protein